MYMSQIESTNPGPCNSLTAIPSHQEAMMTLLDFKQPSWLLTKACKLLALFSTRRLWYFSRCSSLFTITTDHVLFRSLLSIPGSGTLDERMEDEEQKNIYVERLCSHLIDYDRQDADVCQLLPVDLFITQLFSPEISRHQFCYSLHNYPFRIQTPTPYSWNRIR